MGVRELCGARRRQCAEPSGSWAVQSGDLRREPRRGCAGCQGPSTAAGRVRCSPGTGQVRCRRGAGRRTSGCEAYIVRFGAPACGSLARRGAVRCTRVRVRGVPGASAGRCAKEAGRGGVVLATSSEKGRAGVSSRQLRSSALSRTWRTAVLAHHGCSR